MEAENNPEDLFKEANEKRTMQQGSRYAIFSVRENSNETIQRIIIPTFVIEETLVT